jgi:hypothetical protein
MDTRRSFYLAALRDDLDAADIDPVPCTDVPYVMPANDNEPAKGYLRARFSALLCRLTFLNGLNSPF